MNKATSLYLQKLSEIETVKNVQSKYTYLHIKNILINYQMNKINYFNKTNSCFHVTSLCNNISDSHRWQQKEYCVFNWKAIIDRLLLV